MSSKFFAGAVAGSLLLLSGSAVLAQSQSATAAPQASSAATQRPGGAAGAPSFGQQVTYTVANLFSGSDESPATRTASSDDSH